jgi:hypothetical protein
LSFAPSPLISPFPLLFTSFCHPILRSSTAEGGLSTAFSPQSPLSIGSLGQSALQATRKRSAWEPLGNHSGILRGYRLTQEQRGDWVAVTWNRWSKPQVIFDSSNGTMKLGRRCWSGGERALQSGGLLEDVLAEDGPGQSGAKLGRVAGKAARAH